ncbi:MAG: zinc ribbon domain-containing protein [Prevotella sp.]|nr:zinc ribbon domain-containing protein [Prevotella sp.]
MRNLLTCLSVLLLLSSCYNRGQLSPDAWDLTEQQLDSISFYTTHHYTENYNFLVRADSMPIIQQVPAEAISDMPLDTLMVYRDEHLVVADITTVPADSIDSVWVKVARDQLTFGWIHERDLLTAVSPDDPISEFIDFFSDAHLLIFLVFVVMVVSVYVYRKQRQRQAKLVHFNDIDSFYPSLLSLLVATSATLYSSIQLFEPEKWRHFYFHPTLNPFAVPTDLGLFLVSVWAIVIVAVAVLDDVRRQLPFGEAILYLLGLGATCAVAYIIFSVFTLYYIGYPLLVAYFVFAFWCYFRRPRPRFICGRCGGLLYHKGTCPHCGALNE